MPPSATQTIARVTTIALIGLEGREVEVEVQIASGLSAFHIVGLPDKAVAESRERIRAALGAVRAHLPAKRVTVNLAPADLAKEGGHFDLPIALALLIALGLAPEDYADGKIVLGELALDGRIRPVAGVLAAAMAAAQRGMGLICPAESARHASWFAERLSIAAPAHLRELWAHARGERALPPPPEPMPAPEPARPPLDDVVGQDEAKRALIVAAAGGHNLLLTGPPGAGKSMLAERLPGLLPPLKTEDALTGAMIRSIAGESADIAFSRPYRAPHHTASAAALVGGGPAARPGEVSLAHKGVLFLDELPEFARPALEALRQPLEAGEATISRAAAKASYPARFQLIAAMNPCRCGHFDDPRRQCPRAPRCVREYRARLSGPILDRIDMFVDMPALSPLELASPSAGPSGDEAREAVARARAIQRERFDRFGFEGIECNAEASGERLSAIAPLDAASRRLLEDAARAFGLTARAYHRVIRLARTVADLDGRADVDRGHVAEAIGYRREGERGG